jgi:hypothetical protein
MKEVLSNTLIPPYNHGKEKKPNRCWANETQKQDGESDLSQEKKLVVRLMQQQTRHNARDTWWQQ